MKLEMRPVGFPGHFVLTGQEMAAADGVAIKTLKVPGIALMEQAGLRVAQEAHRVCSDGPILIVCGGGNNGGDGFCAARILKGWGRDVEVYMISPSKRVSGDALLQLNACRGADVSIHDVGSWMAADVFTDLSDGLIIDAALGTGLTGTVRGEVAEIFKSINACSSTVLAVDVPSGVCSKTGQILGQAIQADVTVTFQSSKLGHWLYPGASRTGALIIADIGMPLKALAGLMHRTILQDSDLDAALSQRDPNTHKGDYGHVLILGGRTGASGSVLMAADAAMAAGSGLATVGTQPDQLESMARDSYEPMVKPLLTADRFSPLDASFLREYDSVVIGPGFTLGEVGGQMVCALIEAIRVPGVVDADGLNHLVGNLHLLHPGDWVLTPHPGEAARLLRVSTSEVQANRFQALEALVAASKSVVVLKGAHTLIGSPDGEIGICPAGNPGMASAGMGDVLAGIIGAILGRGVSPSRAARAGVLWHAQAGDRAAKVGGVHSLRARDVISSLKEVEACWTG